MSHLHTLPSVFPSGSATQGMHAMQDPEAFEADGGWSFLDMEGDSGEEEEESEEGDPEFQADGDDSEEAGASSEDFRSASITSRTE